MTPQAGDALPLFELPGADGEQWSSDGHRKRNVALVLILHRHLA